jgi:UDP-GlcNAc:undecaprenyl-phosphate GlcNAc-1-phosphate transferase
MNFLYLLLIFLTSSIISVLTTPLVIRIYKKKGWLDDPKIKKRSQDIHKYPVPRGGGIPIFISLFSTSLIFLPPDKHLIGILLGALVILVMGIVDDLIDLNPYLRLAGGFLAAALVVGVGIGIPFITNPFNGIIKLNQPQIPIFLFGKMRTIWVLADIFALVWIVWWMNFVNWSKGIDGQLAGIAVIAALTIAVFSLQFSADITQWPVIILALITAGAYFGFLPWNFYPQRIMPGYGGGALAGFLLAVLTILSLTKVGTGIIVMAVPMIDAVYTIVRRIRAGHSPVWADRKHLHHRLLDLGWSKRKISVFYWLVSAFFGFLALNLNSQAKFYTIVLLIIIFSGFLLWLNYLNTSLSQHDQSSG